MSAVKVAIIATVLAAFIELTTQADGLKEAKPLPAPKLVVVLKRGETKEAQLCWAEGTGRMPVIFLGTDAVLRAGKERNFDGEPRITREGLTVEFDEAESNSVQAELKAERCGSDGSCSFTVEGFC